MYLQYNIIMEYKNIVHVYVPANVTAMLAVLVLAVPSQVTSTPPEPAALTVEGLKVDVLTFTPLARSVRTAVNPPSVSLLSPTIALGPNVATLPPVIHVLHTKVAPVQIHTHILGWSSLGAAVAMHASNHAWLQ